MVIQIKERLRSLSPTRIIAKRLPSPKVGHLVTPKVTRRRVGYNTAASESLDLTTGSAPLGRQSSLSRGDSDLSLCAARLRDRPQIFGSLLKPQDTGAQPDLTLATQVRHRRFKLLVIRIPT